MSKMHRMLSGMIAILAVSCAPADDPSASDPVPTTPSEQSDSAPVPVAQAPTQTAIESAITHLDRPAGDLVDDEKRLPSKVMEFSGIKAGDIVLEMEAGGGYYTELISRIVGEDGIVHMQNPAAFDSFLGDASAQRLKDDRLANVRCLKTDFDSVPLPPQSVDVVTWFLGPHELYYMPSGGEALGDDVKAYSELFRVLRLGGSFIVLDHAARPGSPKSSGNVTHRLDPDIVKALAFGAGFVLVDEADFLRNPNDDYDMGVFEAKVRRQTDRFLLRFVKPS